MLARYRRIVARAPQLSGRRCLGNCRPCSIQRAAGSAPVSYRDAAEIRPVVQLQRRTGLAIESVDAEVWSGSPKPTWIEMLFGWQGALVGVAIAA